MALSSDFRYFLLRSDVDIWLFPRHIPGKEDAPAACHVVNPHFD